MKKIKRRRDRSFGFYCTEEEAEKIKSRVSASIYHSFAEYARPVLLGKPVYMKYGPASMNDLVDELIAVRNGMATTLRHSSLSDEDKQQLMGIHMEIKMIIDKIADLCTQLSSLTEA